LSLDFNFSLEYAMINNQLNQERLELNRTHKLWVYTDVNFLGKNMSTINWNTEAVLDTNRQADLHISIQKTKYIFMLHYQNGGQIKCKCRKQILKQYGWVQIFGNNVTNQNCIHGAIRRLLDSKLFANIQFRILLYICVCVCVCEREIERNIFHALVGKT
jgi:uncharacterized protein YqgQ